MLLHVGNAWCKVPAASARELLFLKNYLTFRSKAFGGATTDRSLLTESRMFPAGLALRAAAAARLQGFEVQVLERPKGVVLASGTTQGTWTARPHQVAALGVLAARRRGLIQHATGAGKSALIAFLTAKLSCRVLVIATSRKLQEDLWQRCGALGVRAGRVGGGFHQPEPRVVVAVVNSLKNMSDAWMASFGAVLADEVHGAASDTYFGAAMRCLGAEFRLGFSGTATERSDRKTMFIVAAFGDVIHRYTPSQAAEDGMIARASVRMLPFDHVPHSTVGGYAAWEARAYARNKLRNLRILKAVSESEAPRIVFTRTHAHQEALVALLGADRCVWVNETVDLGEMDRRVKRLRDGSVGTLVSTPIFRQGVDIPEIRTVVHAGGGKAVVDVIQKVGRGSRRHQTDGSTKDAFLVVDLDDAGCGCGVRGVEGSYAHKSCEWLERHADGRRAAYAKFGYAPLGG